jgi:hypothetical protein
MSYVRVIGVKKQYVGRETQLLILASTSTVFLKPHFHWNTRRESRNSKRRTILTFFERI